MRFQQLAAALFVTAITLPGEAAIIEWSPAFETSGAGDVVTAGTTLEAINLTSTNGDTEVNGVEFEHVDGILGRDFIGALNGGSSGDSSYDILLNSFGYGGGRNTGITIGDDGLIASNFYVVQAWYTDLRYAPGVRVMTLSGGGGGVDLDSAAGGLGKFAVGVFTADSSSEVLELSTSGFRNAHLNAYQVRSISVDHSLGGLDTAGVLQDVLASAGLDTGGNASVPAPATLALLGLGLLRLRRKRSC